MGRWVSFFPECGAKGSRWTVEVWGPGVCSLAVSACNCARALWQGRWGSGRGGPRAGGWERGEGRGHSGSRICLVCGVHDDDHGTPEHQNPRRTKIAATRSMSEKIIRWPNPWSRVASVICRSPKCPRRNEAMRCGWPKVVRPSQKPPKIPKVAPDGTTFVGIYDLWSFMVYGCLWWGCHIEVREGAQSKHSQSFLVFCGHFLTVGAGVDPVPRDVSGKSSRSSRYTPCYGAGLASPYLFGMLSMDISYV